DIQAMSETLDSLIRLHRWQVDERRRQLTELDLLAGKFRLELARLAEERAAEGQSAAGSLLMRQAYPGSIRRSLHREKTLEQSLAEPEQQIAPAREALAEAAHELERYEVAHAARERLRMNAAARRERIETGAIPLEHYRRRVGAR